MGILILMLQYSFMLYSPIIKNGVESTVGVLKHPRASFKIQTLTGI